MHRFAAICVIPAFALIPLAAAADVIRVDSRITDVTVYPEGAKVTRVAAYSVPAGEHRLRLLDLPDTALLDMVRAKVEGARMGSVTMREDFVPPRGDQDSDVVKAARAEVERAEDALRGKQDEAAALRLARDAAETRIGFLKQLGQGETLDGVSAETLRDMARMVGEETLAARQAVLEAEAKARLVDREIDDLQQALDEARQALAALETGGDDYNLVEVSVSAEAATEGVLSVTYFTRDAGWAAVNDAYLSLGDAPGLRLDRGAMIWQGSGENWDDVALTLSTSEPSGQFEPSEVHPWRRRIEEPFQPVLKRSLAMDMAEAPMAAPEPMIEEARVMSFHGLIFNYAYPKPVSLASGADGVRIALGALDFAPEIKAVAAPLWDSTAFLTAGFTNGSGELLLPTQATQLFLEGEYVGSMATDQVAAGAEARLPFGAIDGLQVSRVVTRNEGDTGILSKSNEEKETARIEVENLTGRAWPVRVLDRVPYSEQEDLVITWQARPTPSVTDVDDKKGVLAWDFDIAPGASRQIELSHRIQWPQDMELR
ncbi:DUF4139 domain-containing protein [Thalassovita mangrovi]|uniref:Mucoidy inhibitor MuiA family protein n=1 Tax=Thalassovita mangrovi TaxID=2692236 RepID=A0A6L8LHV8_9RHOB|nr:DUF4139 domain-containing protein [Thalassovita mangrovi]MYM55588.1 mucoidy inhibitor MuiA family protein [Thalassovita mangrovi]